MGISRTSTWQASTVSRRGESGTTILQSPSAVLAFDLGDCVLRICAFCSVEGKGDKDRYLNTGVLSSKLM